VRETPVYVRGDSIPTLSCCSALQCVAPLSCCRVLLCEGGACVYSKRHHCDTTVLQCRNTIVLQCRNTLVLQRAAVRGRRVCAFEEAPVRHYCVAVSTLSCCSVLQCRSTIVLQCIAATQHYGVAVRCSAAALLWCGQSVSFWFQCGAAFTFSTRRRVLSTDHRCGKHGTRSPITLQAAVCAYT